MIMFQVFATWMLSTTRGKLMLWVLERIAFAIGALVTMWCMYTVEHQFMPVITDWKLDYMHKESDGYVVGGTFRKDRSCELVSTSVMAVPKQRLAPRILVYQLKPNEILGGNAPTGVSTWGPWAVVLPSVFMTRMDDISYLEVVGLHKCHALWNQETVYGTIPIERLK